MTFHIPTGYSTTPPGVDMLEIVANQVLHEAEGDPLSLADMRLYLPTKRARRVFQEKLLKLAPKKALILPRVYVLGEPAEEDDLLAPRVFLPPVGRLRRLSLLTKLVERFEPKLPKSVALSLADALTKLLDDLGRSDIHPSKLEDLEVSDFAKHWQITADFLKILSLHWPHILEEEGRSDIASHRSAVLNAHAQWIAAHPDIRVIAAGSTGSQPATAQLLKTIGSHPRGSVLLPALDTALRDEDWIHLKPQDAQFTLKRFLEDAHLKRQDVKPLAPYSEGISALFAPAASGAIKISENIPRPVFIEAETTEEEAQAIALIIRERLHEKSPSIALITPDRTLAQRVCLHLRRWNIQVDDSAGSAFEQAPSVVLRRLVWDMVMGGYQKTDVLCVLKHPLCSLGFERRDILNRARVLDKKYFRGLTQYSSKAGIQKIIDSDSHLAPILQALLKTVSPLESFTVGVSSFSDVLRVLETGIQTFMSLEDQEKDTEQTITAFFGESIESTTDFFVPASQVSRTLSLWCAQGPALRPDYPQDSPVHILGLLEARLLNPETAILAGLNEGAWPPEATHDPWLSRALREQLGISSPDQRIGQSAHDFTTHLMAPHVFITRSKRVLGKPTLPSRLWERVSLYRYDTEMKPSRYIDWARKIDAPVQRIRLTRPAPVPEVEHLPAEISASSLERLIYNPYAFYAAKVLKLEPLEEIEVTLGALERGNIIHSILATFYKNTPQIPFRGMAEQLTQVFYEKLGEYKDIPGFLLFWEPRLKNIADWLEEQEFSRTPVRTRLLEHKLKGSCGKVILTARADRIDIHTGGLTHIIDYKTGTAPSEKKVLQGQKPQLVLEAVLWRQSQGQAMDTPVLEYWKIGGLKRKNLVKILNKVDESQINRAKEGVFDLIDAFYIQKTPFYACPHPFKDEKYDEYDPLTRVHEWMGAS